ncbi:MAG: T9SS type A sorting domain-containing protein [Candidatus Kapabacteria bacterium]|nr:T9SS type A sorting domain-containing protein [Candidatus Kapabacteria bacterium]
MKSFVIVLLICVVSNTNAQTGSYNNPPADLGYPPPAGWTYLCGLDSAVVNYIDAYNDSISISVDDYTKPYELKKYYLRSYNGGVDWDTVRKEVWQDYYIPPVNRTNVNMVKSIKLGTEEITVYVNVKDSTGGCVHSYAYGKHRYFYPFEKEFIVSLIRTISQTQSYSFYFWDIIQNPINADDVMFSLVGGFGDLGAYYRTTDGGQTWGFTKLPPFKYPIENWETNFNRTNKHRRIMYLSGQLGTQGDLAYYETTDDGFSWHRIDLPKQMYYIEGTFWNQFKPDVGNDFYYGLLNESEYRKVYGSEIQWKNSDKLRYKKGIISTELDTINYLRRIYGDKIDEMIIPNTSFVGLTTIRQSSLYNIPNNNRYGGVFVVAEVYGDFYNQFIYYTNDNGVTWVKLLENYYTTNSKFVYGINVDIIANTNNIIIDMPVDYSHSGIMRRHFWKKNIITSVPEQTENTSSLSVDEIFPTPTNDFLTLNFTTTNTEKVTITFYDIHGRKVDTILSQVMYAGKQQVIWERCKQLTNGAYMLEITAGATRINKPVLIVH